MEHVSTTPVVTATTGILGPVRFNGYGRWETILSEKRQFPEEIQVTHEVVRVPEALQGSEGNQPRSGGAGVPEDSTGYRENSRQQQFLNHLADRPT